MVDVNTAVPNPEWMYWIAFALWMQYHLLHPQWSTNPPPKSAIQLALAQRFIDKAVTQLIFLCKVVLFTVFALFLGISDTDAEKEKSCRLLTSSTST